MGHSQSLYSYINVNWPFVEVFKVFHVKFCAMYVLLIIYDQYLIYKKLLFYSYILLYLGKHFSKVSLITQMHTASVHCKVKRVARIWC